MFGFGKKGKKEKKEEPIMAVDTAQIKKQVEDATNLVKKAAVTITDLRGQLVKKDEEIAGLKEQLSKKTQSESAVVKAASELDQASKELAAAVDQPQT